MFFFSASLVSRDLVVGIILRRAEIFPLNCADLFLSLLLMFFSLFGEFKVFDFDNTTMVKAN